MSERSTYAGNRPSYTEHFFAGRARRIRNGHFIEPQFEAQISADDQIDIVAVRGVVRVVTAVVALLVRAKGDELAMHVRRVERLAAFLVAGDVLRQEFADGGYGDHIATYTRSPDLNDVQFYMSGAAQELMVRRAERHPRQEIGRILQVRGEPDIFESDPAAPPSYGFRSREALRVERSFALTLGRFAHLFGRGFEVIQDPTTNPDLMDHTQRVRESGVVVLSAPSVRASRPRAAQNA